MSASLTVSWWESEKKQHGKGAPATGLAAVLKKYESARAAMLKTKTTVNCDAASVALKGVSSTCVTAAGKLTDVKWKELKTSVTLLQGLVKGAQAEIEEIKNDLATDLLIKKAGSHEEEMYEVLWATFEKTRDAIETVPTKKLFAGAEALLGKLVEQAHKVIQADPGAKTKFEKQLIVLAGIKKTLENKEVAYDKAINDGLRLRESVLGILQSAQLFLDGSVLNLGSIKKKALTAKQENDMPGKVKWKNGAEMLLNAAADRFKIANDAFAPETDCRSNADVRRAKVSSDDFASVYLPVSAKMFNVNKANIAAMKTIREETKVIVEL